MSKQKEDKPTSKYGRKALPDNLKRKSSNVYKFECSDKEYEQIKNLMSQRFPNFTNNKAFYLRELILTTLNNRQNMESVTDDFDNKLTQRFVFEINKIGNNLNQITKKINNTKSVLDSKSLLQLNTSLKQIRDLKTEILNTLLIDS